MKKIIFIGLALLLLSSCGQRAWTKRGERRGWVKHETIIDTIHVEKAEKDTVFKNSVVRDTVYLKENKLTVKYFYNNHDSTVYLSGKCDSDTLFVPTYITKIETKDGTDWNLYMILFLLTVLVVGLLISKFRR